MSRKILKDYEISTMLTSAASKNIRFHSKLIAEIELKRDLVFCALFKTFSFFTFRLLVSLRKLIKVAEKCLFEGDEEKSYCMYMKFMNIVSKIQKRPDYDEHKALVVGNLGNNKILEKHFDVLTGLKSSLVKRYEEKYPTLNPQPLAESTRICEEIIEAMSDVTAIPENCDAIDCEQQISDGFVNISAMPTDESEVRQTISCDELLEMMDAEPKLLIIECRPQSDFDHSRITYHRSMNIPEHILEMGATATKIKLNESKDFWEFHANCAFIVIVDASSQRFEKNSPASLLKQIFTEWDEDLTEKRDVLLLEGGYEKWKATYPMLCFVPRRNEPLGVVEAKNASSFSHDSPQIDRTMMLSDIRAYQSNKAPQELQTRGKKAVKKSLEDDFELLNLEDELKKIVNKKEVESSPKKQQKLEPDFLKIDEKHFGERDRVKGTQEKNLIEIIDQEMQKAMEQRNRMKQESEMNNEVANMTPPPVFKIFDEIETKPMTDKSNCIFQ